MATGYFAKKNQINFEIFESGDSIGGNARTFEFNNFLYDSGAHRFHDKIPEITAEIKGLLKSDLLKISIPSHIYLYDRYINFPLAPFNLFQKMGPIYMFGAGLKFLFRRLKKVKEEENFYSFAVNTYGDKIASDFLLNYSEKLWGMPTTLLSSKIHGKRLKGLNISTFIKELVIKDNKINDHLDGEFYYPRYGYGMIAEKLAESCGKENIQTKARITKINHDNRRIVSIQINGEKEIEAGEVVSTIPISLLANLMSPKIPPRILELSNQFKYRNLVLIILLINKDKITESGTIYFPSLENSFTRVYEPKNRSADMSPPGKTSLCLEIPCFESDGIWSQPDEELIRDLMQKLLTLDWFEESEIFGYKVIKISKAYPILEIGFEERVQEILEFFTGFSNLRIIGRNAQFFHASSYELIMAGKEFIQNYLERNN